MNHDKLESRLQSTPLSRPPAEWRAEILAAVGENPPMPVAPDRAVAAPWRRMLREVLWPHPAAWATIAALWVAVGTSQIALREPNRPAASMQVAVSSNAPTLLVMERQLASSQDDRPEKPKGDPAPALPPQSHIGRRPPTVEA